MSIVLRTGTCPTGKGNKCETLHRDTPRAYPRSGVAPARRHVSERRRMQGVPVKKIAPCNSRPPEQVEAYYRNVKPGDAASLRLTYGNISQYQLDKISGANPKRGWIYLEKAQGIAIPDGPALPALQECGHSDAGLPMGEQLRRGRQQKPPRWEGPDAWN
jgi:hypothetical protein